MDGSTDFVISGETANCVLYGCRDIENRDRPTL